jgi:hypothetical protein
MGKMFRKGVSGENRWFGFGKRLGWGFDGKEWFGVMVFGWAFGCVALKKRIYGHV